MNYNLPALGHYETERKISVGDIREMDQSLLIKIKSKLYNKNYIL
jgi:hypothetical protein